MGEVFITRKGGGGKAAAPTIAVTDVGGTWIELEITNTDAAASGATIFVLVNYDPTSETDFDLQAAQNGFVFTVAQGAMVTQLVTGLDPDTSHTVSASAAVIKKLPSSVVTTDTINLSGTGITTPTVGPIVTNESFSTVVTVTNNDTTIPLVIKANVTTSTTPPTVYPFETASLATGASTNLTITGLTPETTYYIHARAFDGEFSSSNVVFGPYTTLGLPGSASNPIVNLVVFDATNPAAGTYFFSPPDATGSLPVQLFYQKNLQGTTQGWVRVFRSPYRGTANVNFYGLNFPITQFMVRRETGDIWQTAGWSSGGYRRFNSRNTTSDLSNTGTRSGYRVFFGFPGGHGIYNNPGQQTCNWGTTTGAIGAGYDGANCGTFPNNLVWGTGGAVTYDNRSGTWAIWIRWE